MKKSTGYRLKYYWLAAMEFTSNGLSHFAYIFAIGGSFLFAFEFFGFTETPALTPDWRMFAYVISFAILSHVYGRIGEILENQAEYVHYEMEQAERKEAWTAKTGKENEFEEIEF